jgi:hypothetical protein
VGVAGVTPLPSPPPNFPAGSWIFYYKDDVIILLLLDIFFMVYAVD